MISHSSNAYTTSPAIRDEGTTLFVNHYVFTKISIHISALLRRIRSKRC
jgi:hypothetical protein